jgi:hypothetical protein
MCLRIVRAPMRPLLAVFFAAVFPAMGQYKMQTPAGEAPGPWLFGTIGVGKAPDGKAPQTTALKGLAIKLGEKGEAGIAYDLDLCRVAGAWTGGKFVTPMNLMSRGEYPTAMGQPLFVTGEVAGFGKGRARFRGLHICGGEQVLAWDVNGTQVLEMPAYARSGGVDRLIRRFQVAPGASPFSILLAPAAPAGGGTQRIFVAGTAEDRVRSEGGAVWLDVPSPKGANEPNVFVVEVLSGADKAEVDRLSHASYRVSSLEQMTHGGTARWPESVVTGGQVSQNKDEAYVVDTIKLPDPNPWAAPMFIGGFDFFPDGRAAVCTFHGDVFIVSGLDATLEKVTWRRFASGLYHALGLKIVNGDIFVTCRDGIWRLRDANKDGEADFYEPFNFDVKVTKSFHEFVFDLQTDRAGNFYFAKAGPVKNGGRGFDEIMDHHGTLVRVSPDGKKLDVVATGFRAPNGIGVGPRGELTSGDNEGTWTPACKINWIRPGGFYGVVDLAHRAPPPTDYDRPLCWLPKRVDNSGGSQVWVPEGDRWGPWSGQMLHLSYGQAALFGVMREDLPKGAPGSVQGGVAKFPLKFDSGIMRARFHPVDGQLYVAGLRGWQTSGAKNGCLQRVRYTGAQTRMPIELRAKKTGVEIKFACSLDTQSAADPESWNVEVWNYVWSSAYGSPEVSTLAVGDRPAEAGKAGVAEFTKAQMSKTHHDTVRVKSVSVGTDDRTVFLELEGMKPVMQMSIRYGIKSADDVALSGEVVNTVHALAE